ncbi:MAG: histidinol-phosphate aminotransferase [Cycloclasticus sp. symbiont of Poecilosclerida sp. N]|nr:MAG: histidinol-phosphate aminotransferase [Cycloclasticus sp. symbiont of Poecilosclerida sp. N]
MSSIIEKIERLIRPEIKEMQAYNVSEATGLVKLDAMENPFTWPEQMKSQWLELLAQVEPNRYPDSTAKKLVQCLRSCFGISSDLGVVLGNGSDELIQILIMAMKEGTCVMAPTPSFVMYEHIANALGVKFVGSPLSEDFSLDMPAMLEAIKTHDPAIIFLAYPNNPTANLFEDDDVLEIIRASNGVVVIDEAYQPFADKTFLDKAQDFEQLLVMRTVSKLGLAGLRLGYLVGHRSLIEQFEKIRLPYNINTFTQLTANFAFQHIDVLNAQAKLICEEREILFKKLSVLEGLQVFPSKANFLLFSLWSDSAQRVFEELKKAGILIKKMGEGQGLPPECLRVTIGSSAENERFFDTFKSILK